MTPTPSAGSSSPSPSSPPVTTVAPPLLPPLRRPSPPHRLRDIPAIGNGPYREEARQIPELQLLGGLHGRTTFPDPSGGPILARLYHQLLRIDPEPGGPPERLRVRRLAITCPEKHVFKDTQSTTYLWLGVLGHTHVILGDPSGPVRLSLQLHLDLRGVSLSISSEHAHLSSPLRPDLVGHAFTFDDHLVEIVDIEAGGDTPHDGQRWHTDGFAPLVHLQLAITPQPPACPLGHVQFDMSQSPYPESSPSSPRSARNGSPRLDPASASR